MKENINDIDDLIISFLSDELNSEDRKKLMEWINESDMHRDYFLQRQEVWFSALSKEENARYNPETAFHLFQQKVAAFQLKQEKALIHPYSWMWVRYAAAVVLVGLITYFSYRQGEENLREALTDIEVTAPMGSRVQIRLPDGSLVTLNAGSHITYAQDFGVDNREVHLQGEGYFEVNHNEKIPFYVHSKNLQVKVLGTKFNFKDYPEDRKVTVSLIEGKVALCNQNRQEEEYFLKPKERASYNKSDGTIKIESAQQVDTDVNWQQGILSFNEVSLTEVAQSLERCYNVRITLNNTSLPAYRVYATFNRTEQSIKDVLEVLTATGKIHYTIKGNNVVLY